MKLGISHITIGELNMSKLRSHLRKLNPTHAICNSLVGHHHTFRHRAAVGIAIMIAGVLIAKYFGHSDVQAVAVCGDCVGYGLHGIGLIPFAEGLVAMGAVD
jgi:hypothetical protein